MKLNKLFKGIVITGISSLILMGCSSNTPGPYGLTRGEYKLVDKYYDADKMVEDLESFGYSDEEIERQLRGALNKVKSETGQ